MRTLVRFNLLRFAVRAELPESSQEEFSFLQLRKGQGWSELPAPLGSIGPMVNLIGTLKGMIGSFSVIATSEAQVRTSAGHQRNSEVLLLTFDGMALLAPAFISSWCIGILFRRSLLARFCERIRC